MYRHLQNRDSSVFHWGNVPYRYTFNAKETDTESDLQDYGMRIYNPRLGKFLSVDPLTRSFPWYTPYQFAGNMPIWAIDLDGMEPFMWGIDYWSFWMDVAADNIGKSVASSVPGVDNVVSGVQNMSEGALRASIAENKAAPEYQLMDEMTAKIASRMNMMEGQAQMAQGFTEEAIGITEFVSAAALVVDPLPYDEALIGANVMDEVVIVADKTSFVRRWMNKRNAIRLEKITAKNQTYKSNLQSAMKPNGCTTSKNGSHLNRLEPDQSAGGPHTSYKTNANGKVRNYVVYTPNPKNPTGFDERKRVDLEGGAHVNKVTKESIPTPHTHDKNVPGGVRPAKTYEIPRK
jgi:RHS repeat-associated protein